MTIERPMFPPRAESQDSIIYLRRPGDRPDETPPGGSPTGTEGDARVIAFRTGRPVRPRKTFLFRSYDLIVASSEADLVRDVCLDIDKAQTKLKAIRSQLLRDREHAVAREGLLAAADTKLSAAIVAALLSTHGRSEG